MAYYEDVLATTPLLTAAASGDCHLHRRPVRRLTADAVYCQHLSGGSNVERPNQLTYKFILLLNVLQNHLSSIKHNEQKTKDLTGIKPNKNRSTERYLETVGRGGIQASDGDRRGIPALLWEGRGWGEITSVN